AFRPLSPTEKMLMLESSYRCFSYRPSRRLLECGKLRRRILIRQAYPAHDGDQLVGIGRIGGITRRLQGACGLFFAGGLAYGGIARRFTEQAGVIGNCGGVIRVDAETVADTLPFAGDIFVG